ncbi:MAG: hypothetical protein EA383_13730 [Spirochaetaceae bacterium]|nr:MAG: hypothetical protein EA383_13730 [Spirochaetaceae bacterium]
MRHALTNHRYSFRVPVFVFLLVLVSHQAFAQSGVAAFVIERLRGPIVNAVDSTIEVEDSGPFVDAVVAFLRDRDDEAAIHFVSGLIVNSIDSEEDVENVLTAIAGVSSVSQIVFVLAGQRQLAARLGAFQQELSHAPAIERWREAKATGDDVQIVDGELVVEEQVAVEEQEDDQPVVAVTETPTYVQRRDDEVMPLLNVIHGRRGAEVILDGESVGHSLYEEYMFDDLPAGLREITIRDNEYESSLMVFVNPGRETEANFDEVELRMERGYFTLQVEPDVSDRAAETISVYVDGVNLGAPPIEADIRTGTRQVELRSAWTERYAIEVTGQIGDTQTLAPNLVEYGAIRFADSIPASTMVSFDDASDLEEVRYGRRMLRPGTYRVRLEDDAGTFEPLTVEVTVVPFETSRVEPDLSFRLGQLRVTELPPATSVYLDGERIHEPVSMESSRLDAVVIPGLVIGERVIALDSPFTEDPYVFPVTLREGQTVEVSAEAARLELSGMAPDAEIHLNGHRAESVSFAAGPDSRAIFLPPGTYEYELRSDQYPEPPSGSVTLEPSDRHAVSFDDQQFGQLRLALEVGDTLDLGPIEVEHSSEFVYEIESMDGEITIRSTVGTVDSSIAATVARWFGGAEETEEGDDDDPGVRQLRTFLPPGTYTASLGREDDTGPPSTVQFEIEPWSTHSAHLVGQVTSELFMAELGLALDDVGEQLAPARRARVVRNVAFGTSIAAGVFGGYAIYRATSLQDEYHDAATTSKAVELRGRSEAWGLTGSLSLGGAIGFATAGTISAFLSSPDPELLATERALETRIEELR